MVRVIRASSLPTDQAKIVMEEVTDPIEIERAQQQRERFDRNSRWLQENAADVYPRFRGQYICIAGQEVFAAAAPLEARALGARSHPEDNGAFVMYIPQDKLARIYVHWR